MIDDIAALVEQLRALHVWPQMVADEYADTLRPRQIEMLYEVGNVSHAAAAALEAQQAEITELAASLDQAVSFIDLHKAEIEKLRFSLSQCRDQFAFYASEHTSAGKFEKAATNQRFADLASAALGDVKP